MSEEINLAYSYLSDWRRLLPNARIIYIPGNHEFRLISTLIAKVPELYDLLSLPELLKLKDINIEWVPFKDGATKFQHTYINIDGVFVGHYDRVSKHAGFTGKNLQNDLGVSLVQAHVHRLGLYNVTYLDGRVKVAAEGGCMCKLNPDYLGHANWQQGVVLIENDGLDNFVTVLPINNYKIAWGGKIYI